MGLGEDTPLQFDYDPQSQTLHITVLTEEDLDSLAGYNDGETSCETCRNVEACPDAHRTAHPCGAFIDWRDTF
jgi:hypothetical protein